MSLTTSFPVHRVDSGSFRRDLDTDFQLIRPGLWGRVRVRPKPESTLTTLTSHTYTPVAGGRRCRRKSYLLTPIPVVYLPPSRVYTYLSTELNPET